MSTDAIKKPASSTGQSLLPRDSPDSEITETRQKVLETHYTKVFEDFMKRKPGLDVFYKGTAIDDAIKRAKVMGDKLQDLECSSEYATQLTVLTLYNIALLLDDSGSIEYEQDGKRKETLQKTLEEITKVYDLANDTGISSVRFLNNEQGKKNVTHAKIEGMFRDRIYLGDTRIGTAMKKKVLQPFVWGKPMTKPLLVMTITDGDVEGEKRGLLRHHIKECVDNIRKDETRGEQAVSFHFSCIGDGKGAHKHLKHLNSCPEVGKYVDFLPMTDLHDQLKDPSLKWRFLCKFLLGAIDPKWGKEELEFIEDLEDIDYSQFEEDEYELSDEE